MKHRVRFSFVLALIGFSLSAIGQQTPQKPAAVTPIPRSDAWWVERHADMLAEAKARGDEVELLFIGDSITHGWDKGLWAEHFDQYGALNLGFSGDRTEHVLWRIQDGALKHLSPKVTVLMIGTNNTGQGEGQPPEETLQGITAIIDEINSRLPDTHLIVHAIFPRDAQSDGPLRVINEKINAALPSVVTEKGAEFLNINSLFLEKDGTLPRSVMPDLLHPKKRGYALWAAGLQPSLDRLLDKPKKQPKHEVLSLWPNGVPQPHDPSLVETSESSNGTLRISNVSDPSITLYLLGGRRIRPAVLVCPGGGYNILAWDKEGTEIAEWLNSIGVSAAVLKYRTPKNREGALQDAQRAMGLLRHNAKDWKLDPQRIGVLGFSAGGHLSATVSNTWQKRRYAAVDQADTVSCRPDFTVLVYPAYLGDDALNLTADFVVNEQTPPAFIVQTQDDKKYIASAIAYYTELHLKGRPAELHIFPKGGHGYGLRPSAYPVSNWSELCGDWILNR